MKTLYTTSLPFFILAFGLALIIASPHLFSDGMFMDGLFYATISRNLSEGIGSFWFLKFTEACHPAFHEHPPLVFGIQSLFFSVFGDSIFVERFYSLFTYLISGIIIHFIWKEFVNKKELSWLPLVLWVCVPLVTWSLANNILENTLTIFILLSFLFLTKSLQKNSIFFIFLGGLSIASAFLAKGFVGLFTWSFFGVLWLTSKKISFPKAILNTILLIFFSILPFIILSFFYYESIESLKLYFEQQVINSLKNIQTVPSRFYILWRAFTEMITPILIIGIAYFILRKKYKIEINGTHPYRVWLFVTLGIGLTGVLPIMISLKQSGFYIMAAFPFFCLSLSLFLSPYLEQITLSNTRFQKIVVWLSLSILVLGIGSSIYHTNKIMRDHEKLEDFYIIQQHVPANTVIGICHELDDNWSLHGYYYRYAHISLAINERYSYNDVDFFLSINDCEVQNLKDFEKMNLPTKTYSLYKKK